MVLECIKTITLKDSNGFLVKAKRGYIFRMSDNEGMKVLAKYPKHFKLNESMKLFLV